MFALQVDEGLELRLFELRHAAALLELVEHNKTHLARWMPWAAHTSLENQRAFIASGLQQFAKSDGFQVGIYDRGALVGACGLHYIRPDTQRTEVGYWLAEEAQGKGVMTRVCAFLCTYAFDELGLHRVEIRCASQNLRSRAVPERLGFKEEGTLRQIDKLPSGWVDWVIYGMLADEWRQLQG